MKKLIIFCLIVLLVGCGLAAGGVAAGGELYGAYYNGALHPVREALSDVGSLVRGSLRYHAWRDDDGAYHSGWFSDRFDDWFDLDDIIEDAVERRVRRSVNAALSGAIDDALDHAMDEVDGTLDAAFSDTTIYPAKSDSETTTELDFKLTGGEFCIAEGDRFSITGATPNTNQLDGGEWKLKVDASEAPDGVVITLPAKGRVFKEIFISAQDCDVTFYTPLAAEEFDIALTRSTLLAGQEVTSPDADFNLSDSELSLPLRGAKATTIGEDYFHIEAKADESSDVMVNDEYIAGARAGKTINRLGNGLASFELDLKAESSTIDISLIPSYN